jgi:iron(III) transport system permease protein
MHDSAPPRSGSLIAALWRALSLWRARRRASPVWSVVVVLILAVIAMPVVTVLALAVAPADNIWPKLLATVLPSALYNTLALMILTGALTLATGAATAWLVTMYRFPGRALADRLLVLPLAIPTYIIAYVYADLLSYAGPIQTAIRSLFGLGPGSGAVLPEIARSLAPSSSWPASSIPTSTSAPVRASSSNPSAPSKSLAP